MEIRKCNETDIHEVYNLICELEAMKFDFKDFKITFNNKINNDKNYCILVLEDNKIIGYLGLNVDYQLHHAKKIATIEELVVNSEYRSNGAGKMLIDNAKKYAKNSNCEIIEVTSNIIRKRAHDFYIKNGFEKSSYKFKMEL